MESEIEETDYDSVEETSSGLSTGEWEDETDSWETDNGLTTEDDAHANAPAEGVASPAATPMGSIVDPEDAEGEGLLLLGKAPGATSPSPSGDTAPPGPEEEGAAAAAAAAAGGVTD